MADTTTADTTKTATEGQQTATGDKGTQAGQAGQTASGGQQTGAATVLTDGGTDKVVSAPATWPEDWRDKLAAGDDKMRKRLDRFTDPGAILKSYTQLEQRVQTGGLKPAAPAADAKPEELAAWRKEAGIPEKAEGYLETLDKGLVINEQDKAALSKVLEAAHTAHTPPAAVAAMVGAYYAMQENNLAQQATKDNEARVQTEEALRADWGTDYRRHLNAITGYLDIAPEGVKANIMNARSADGVPLLSNPAVVKFLLSAAMENNPAATVVPGASSSSGVGIAERKTAIEKVMRENRRAYDRDAKMQQEYRDLLDAEQKLSARGRAA